MVEVGRVVNCGSRRLSLGSVGTASAVVDKISFLLVRSVMDGCGSSSGFQNTAFRFNLAQ